ncbi:tape measure protein [Devosia beringensis]|uniref:tape measure protein n=1 Tax=Devosia beringensis TaxID=2657486 RepID=UPI001E3DC21C|nr:tape measure protein [Devosia beringensis]
MATDVERLVVSLEASLTKFDRNMQRAVGISNTSMQKIERRHDTMAQRLEKGYSGLQRGIAAAFGGALALRGAQQLIDASTRIENSLKVAGLAGEELASVYDSLFESAQRNAAPLESLVTLYGRAAIVQKELGVSTQELLGFTDNVATALRVAGTDAQTASGALLQLSQALGSGTVRAEEFNSILEGALPVAQAAAAGLEEAGGSVAKLRGLVVDGKVSSEAFFRAFEAGSVILRDKVASSELTVSQGFIRLQNVLIDTAGKFDNATNASSRMATFLTDISNRIAGLGNAADANAPAINRFLDFILEAGDKAGRGALDQTAAEFEAIAEAVNFVAGKMDKYGASVTDAELATAAAEQALVNFSTNAAAGFGDLEPVVQDLIQQLLEGKGTANLANEAINEIGKNQDFGTLIGDLGSLVNALFAVRSEAVATAGAVAAAARGDSSGGNIADQRAEQLGNRPKAAVKPVSLSDYAAPTAAGGSGGVGGGGSSRADQFVSAVANQEREIAALQRKSQLQAQLNPLVNDYGFALERLNAQMELENAATEAGLALTPERQAQIALLSQGFAQATSDAARLAEAQDMVKQSAEEMAQAGRQALDTIVDGFRDGRDAGEIFNSVLKDLAKNLLNMGINSISGGMKSGGFNPLGFLGGLFGFASGTANTGGKRGEPRGVVHGQEAVIPLPGGGKVPVDLRLPSLPSAGPSAGSLTVHVVSDDEKFSAYVIDKAGAVVAQASPSIVGASVNQANKTAPAAVAKFREQRGGSDYRTS